MAAGIPALLDPATDLTPQPLLTADSPAIQPSARVPAWGIYDHDTSTLAIGADSILKLEYKATARISNAPQEDGAFQAYNKVQAPYESRIQMTKGGSESDRAAFLDALETAKQSLNLYDIVMPERAYLNANITGYHFTRTARSGVTLLTVEVMFEEVRQASAPQFTSTTGGGAQDTITDLLQSPSLAPKNPAGADPVHAGTRQPVTPTTSQSRLADAILNSESVVP
jgi:hypothetical protein